jgi:hypothetical protein
VQDSGDSPERKTRSVSNSLSIMLMLREECGGEHRSTNDAIYAQVAEGKILRERIND